MPPPTPRPRAPTASTTALRSLVVTITMLGPGRAVEEVPRRQGSLLALDDQHALAGQDEKRLLGVLAVVHAHRLAGLEHVDVDPEARKPPLPLERAVRAESSLF